MDENGFLKGALTMKKHISMILLALLVCLAAQISVCAAEVGDTFDFNGVTYQVLSEDTVALASAQKCTESVFQMPDAVTDGQKAYAVTEIKENAFFGNQFVAIVSCHNKLTKIGSKAFSGIAQSLVLELYRTTPPEFAPDVFADSPDVTVKVGMDVEDAYRAAIANSAVTVYGELVLPAEQNEGGASGQDFERVGGHLYAGEPGGESMHFPASVLSDGNLTIVVGILAFALGMLVMFFIMRKKAKCGEKS